MQLTKRIEESGQTTWMTTGVAPYCETVNLSAPWSGWPSGPGHSILTEPGLYTTA